MNEREKVLAEIRERLERADDGRLAFVLAFLRAGERAAGGGGTCKKQKTKSLSKKLNL